MPHVVIVGAGISGLSLAYRLQERNPALEIIVVEAGNRIGGTIWTHREDGFQVEAGPNGFLATKPNTFALCRDIGLGTHLIEASPVAKKNRYLNLDGQLRALPNGLASFLTSDLLSWRGKISLLWERFRRSQSSYGDESIAAFAQRRAGSEVARVFADALVTGIYAGDPALLSARACFPRLTALEAEHGSILKGLAKTARQRRSEPADQPSGMWSLREGLRVLVEHLAAMLKQSPVLGAAVEQITQQDGASPRWKINVPSEAMSADAVVLTCPAYQQAAILDDLDHELADRIGTIPYNRIAVVALGFRKADVPRPLDGFGYIAPQSTRRDVLGVQWCSSIYPGRAPEGMVLLRAMCGGWHRAEVAGWDDARLVVAVRADLQQALGIHAPPTFQQIIRWERAIPQYHLRHLERVAWIEARLARYAGLFVGGNAYYGVSLNDCTEQGELLAERVDRYLSKDQPPRRQDANKGSK